jgi:hypothetical protein
MGTANDYPIVLGRTSHMFASSDGWKRPMDDHLLPHRHRNAQQRRAPCLAQRRPAAHDRRPSRQPPRRPLVVELATYKRQGLSHVRGMDAYRIGEFAWTVRAHGFCWAAARLNRRLVARPLKTSDALPTNIRRIPEARIRKKCGCRGSKLSLGAPLKPPIPSSCHRITEIAEVGYLCFALLVPNHIKATDGAVPVLDPKDMAI